MSPRVGALSINVDQRPLELFIALFQRALERSQGPLNTGEIDFEVVRFERDDGAARAGELCVTAYPTDAFMRFAAAACAGDGEGGGVDGVLHGGSLISGGSAPECMPPADAGPVGRRAGVPAASPWQPGSALPPEGVDVLVVWAIPGWCLHGPSGLARYEPETGWWSLDTHDFAAAPPAWWMAVPPVPGAAP